MRVMLAIVAAAALGWTGWWFVMAAAKERAIEAWLAERRAAGWVAEAEAIDVAGFPYRVDTTVRGLELADPGAGWSWRAPQFQFLSLAYAPNQLIAIFPPMQTLATPLGEVTIASKTMMASLTVEPDLALALDHATLDVADLALDGPGWRVTMDRALLSTRQAEGPDAPAFAHDVAFSAEGLVLPESWTRGVDAGGGASGRAEAEARATFDRPWDRPAIEGATPALLALDVRDAEIAWGRIDLRGRGDLVADADGFAEGRLDLRARGWRGMVDGLAASGALPAGLADALRGGLGLLAGLTGDRDALELPLEFRGGGAYLGPIPVGAAPRLNRGPA